MAQRQVGATNVPQNGFNSLSPSNLHGQSVQLDENAMVRYPRSLTVGEGDTQHAVFTKSQSHTLTPSHAGTLKKRQSLGQKNSLKRSGSRKHSHAGSVRSLTVADDVDANGSEMNSAFFTPVPTTGSPTDILANRFQGRLHCAHWKGAIQGGSVLIRLIISLAQST